MVPIRGYRAFGLESDGASDGAVGTRARSLPGLRVVVFMSVWPVATRAHQGAVANPWIAAPVPAIEALPPLRGAATRPVGPTVPQPATVQAPPTLARLPVSTRLYAAQLWWLGVHGGAGESTLAGFVPGSVAAHHAWPAPIDGARAQVVLVARTHQRGLTDAQSAATEWAAGLVPHVDLLGLVLLADAPGRLPRPLREHAQLVSGGVPRTWTVPWVEQWRLDVATVPGPREVQRLVADLSGLLARPGLPGDTDRKERYQ